jgi:hypothetical protein
MIENHEASAGRALINSDRILSHISLLDSFLAPGGFPIRLEQEIIYSEQPVPPMNESSVKSTV